MNEKIFNEGGFNKDKVQKAKEDWDERHKIGWGIDESGGERKPESRVIEFFETQKGKIETVLDIACGNGRHVVPLAQMGFKVSGVDFSSAGLEKTKEKLETKNLSAILKEGNFHSLPFSNESFEATLSTNAINRNDWAGAKVTFKEIARVLKPDGVFYLRVRSLSKTIYKPDEEVKVIEEPEDPEFNIKNHGITFSKRKDNLEEPKMHAYSDEELVALGEYAGLEVIRKPVDDNGQWDIIFRKSNII